MTTFQDQITTVVARIAAGLLQKGVVKSKSEAIDKAKTVLKEIIQTTHEAADTYRENGYSKEVALNMALRDLKMAIAMKQTKIMEA